MTLEKLLLERLADWRPDTNAKTLTVDHDPSGWRAALTADAVDTLGVRLLTLEVRRLRAHDGGPLAEQAARLAAFTGLLEPLSVLEIDTPRGVAQLRSTAPAKDGPTLHYYELLRHADGSTHLSRYEASSGAARRAVPFTLTHEALAKAVRAFAS